MNTTQPPGNGAIGESSNQTTINCWKQQKIRFASESMGMNPHDASMDVDAQVFLWIEHGISAIT